MIIESFLCFFDEREIEGNFQEIFIKNMQLTFNFENEDSDDFFA